MSGVDGHHKAGQNVTWGWMNNTHFMTSPIGAEELDYSEVYRPKQSLPLLKYFNLLKPGGNHYTKPPASIINSLVTKSTSSLWNCHPWSCSSLHLANDGITKFGTFQQRGAIHQAVEIVGYCLGSDCTLHCFSNQISSFIPAHITDHHLS